MRRTITVAAVTLLLALSTSCKESRVPPVSISVLRDPSFAADLTKTNAEFVGAGPHLTSGRAVVLESKDDIPYLNLSERLQKFRPQVLILSSEHSVPDDLSIRGWLGASQTVCGIHSAFVPFSVREDQREAAEVYVHFLASHCPSIVVQQPKAAESQQEEPDPHRPPCLTAHCRKIEQYLKDRYCGESPFGNGPENGCDYKEPFRSGARLTVSFHCDWDESNGKSTCRQIGQPSADQRAALLRELRRLGLPPQGDEELTYTVVESSSGWTLMSADYDHVNGTDTELCEVVLAIDQRGNIYVLRTVRRQKTSSDAPEVTEWSPYDIADVDGDGQVEFVLRGDAYEDHWLEVLQIEAGSTKTIFSGLGYYL